MILGLVAAKDNSNRFPGKNKHIHNGEPLFWHSVKPLLDSKIDDVYVITDSNYIKSYCEERNVICGISGSVTIQDLSYLIKIHPNFIGLRGQLCTSQRRRSKLDRQQVSIVLREFDYALNNSNSGRTLSNVSLYSKSTSES